MFETSHGGLNGLSPARREELRRLVEMYSIRTRELSEALSIVGGHLASRSEIDKTMNEVKRIRPLAEQAGVDLMAFIERLEL